MPGGSHATDKYPPVIDIFRVLIMLVKKESAMTSATFDSLGYFEKLKAAGVPEQQAKVQADAMREIIEDKLATKRDLLELEKNIDVKLRELEYRVTANIIKWVAGMLVAQAAVVAALVKLL
jgi:hypothetical protein